jgi:hypothetical protein
MNDIQDRDEHDGFQNHISNIERNLCGNTVKFTFPSSGVYHYFTRDRINEFTTAMSANKSVHVVELVIEERQGYDYTDLWSALGKAFNNMERLIELRITRRDPWDLHAGMCIAGQCDRLRELFLRFNYDLIPGRRLVETQLRMLAGALSSFVSLEILVMDEFATETPDVDAGVVFDALSNLPKLRRMTCNVASPSSTTHFEDGSLARFVKNPSLRQVCFGYFYFDTANCHSIAEALSTETFLESLDLQACEAQDEETLIQGLETNQTVKLLGMMSRSLSRSCYRGLARVMSANTTLTQLTLEGAEAAVDAASEMKDFFFALQRNTTLKLLDLDDVSIHEDATSTMRECLALNTGLENIKFSRLEQYYHQARESTCEQSTLLSKIAPFLVLNRTLKELTLFELDLTGDDFVLLAKLLADNVSLQRLEIRMQFQERSNEDVVTFASYLKKNRTLKYLDILCTGYNLAQYALSTENGDRVVSELCQNYELRRIQISPKQRNTHTWGQPEWRQKLDAFLRLNIAGRRYLWQDASDRRACVAVLSGVSSSLNCLYLHLLENPLICNIAS